MLQGQKFSKLQCFGDSLLLALHKVLTRQHKDESLGDYVHHFQAESIQCVGLINDMKLLTIMHGLQHESKIIYSISENLVKKMAEFLNRATKFINYEEDDKGIVLPNALPALPSINCTRKHLGCA